MPKNRKLSNRFVVVSAIIILLSTFAGAASGNLPFVSFLPLYSSGANSKILSSVIFSPAATLKVSPSNLQGWTTQTGTCGALNTSSAQFVGGPPAPPLGVGSFNIKIGADGDSYYIYRNTAFDGTALTNITALSYSTYVTTYIDSQAVALNLKVDTDNDNVADDTLWFEPAYQGAAYFPSNPQGPLTTGTWQTWDALNGAWYADSGAAGSGPGVAVKSLAAIIAALPAGSKIAPNPGVGGGIRLYTGCGAGSWDNFDGNVDNLTVGVSAVNTTYNFDPDQSTYVVDDDGLATAADCDAAVGAFTTIQSAVDVANPGESVLVCPGTYNEVQILIQKSISVTSVSGAATTIVDGGLAAPPFIGLVRVDLPALDTGNVLFSGFTVRNPGLSGGSRYHIFGKSMSPNSTVTFSNNVIPGINLSDYGFYSDHSTGAVVFDHNQLTNNAFNPILIERPVGATDVHDNTISGSPSTAYFNMTYLSNDVASLQRVANNTINASTGSGIAFNASPSFVGVGSRFGKYSNVQITGNTISQLGASRTGISLLNDTVDTTGALGAIENPIVTGNSITGTNAANSVGIRLRGLVTNASIRGNNIRNAARGFSGDIVNTHSATGTQAHFNNIVGNTTGMFWDAAAANAENNWWGCNAGPGNAGCDTIGGGNAAGVDFNPWLVLRTSASPSSINVLGSSTITADLTHNSDGTALGNTPPDVVPNTPVTWTATNGNMSPNAGTIGAVTPGSADSTYTNTNINANSASACATVDNQQTCVALTISPQADLVVTKSDGGGAATAGGSTVYTLTLTNNGPNSANGTTISDPAASGLTKTSIGPCTASGGAVCPASGAGPGQLNISNLESGSVVVPTLPSGGGISFTVSATVNAVSGNVTNTFSATPPAGTSDPTPATAVDTNSVSCGAFSTVYVDDNWVGTTPGTDPDGAGPATIFGCDSFDTIQGGVNAVTTGGTVVVLPGTYSEAVTINKRLTLDGAGSGNNPAVDTILNGSVAGNGNAEFAAITITGTGASAASRLTVQDMRIIGTQFNSINIGGGAANASVSFATIRNVFMDGTLAAGVGPYARGVLISGSGSMNDIELDAITANNFYNGGISMSDEGTFPSVNGFRLTNSSLTNNRIGLHTYGNAGSTSNQSRFTNVTITNNVVTDNEWKGFYFEVLDNAVIRGNTFNHDGFSNFAPPRGNSGNGNAGLELNLKYGAYNGVQILNNIFDNSGVYLGAGTDVSGALAIKPRNIGSYAANPASLNDVQVKENLFRNIPAVGGKAILIGEYGTALPTNMVISFNALTDGTFKGIANTANPADGPVNAIDNWWGCNYGPGATGPGCSIVTASNSGPVTSTPWMVLGTSASPNPIPAGGSSTVTADMTNDSTPASTGNTPPNVLPNLPVTWTATNGTMTPPANSTNLGIANSVYQNTNPNATSAQSCATVNNQQTCTTITIVPTSDLSITKTDGVTTVTAGGVVTYTITASNAGPTNASGSTVADTFPASLTCTWTGAGAGGGTGTASGSGNISDTVNLPAGGSFTYTATCTISGAATGSLSNTATVAAPAGVTDPTPGNNSATDTDTIASSADLSITKTDGVTSATPGGTVTYTVTAANLGPSTATGVSVTDAFPASLTCSTTSSIAGGASGNTAGPFAGNISNSGMTLPSGSTVTYTSVCTVNAAATGTLSNTATVSSAVTDPNPGNNSATDTDTLSPQANLGITKTDGVTTATAGGSVTYTITASNAGPSSAPGSTVADTFPASLTCTWTGAGAGGGTGTASGSGNINDTVNLPAGGSFTYTASCTVSGAATGTLSNTATVAAAAGVTDPTPGNNSATDTDTITVSPDLSITKTDGVTSAVPGNSVTYTITVSNSGPSNATGATVADTLPGSISGATWTCTGSGGGTCTASGSGNINNTVNLPSGGSVTYTVTAPVAANATGTLSNTATVTAPGGATDPNPGNNSATDSDTLTPTSDLSITKTDGATSAVPGSSVTYTITASNAGPSVATGTTIADTIPAGLTCSTTSTAAGGATGNIAGPFAGNINNSGVTLPGGGSVTYTSVCQISASATGSLTNTATVTAGAGITDPTPANNSATDTDTLSPTADLSITKTDGVTSANQGGSVTYTITATNAGPSSVTGATVTDVLPAAITGSNWTCTGSAGGSCGASGSGNINQTVNLPSGGSVTFTVISPISDSATGSLSNTATIAAPAGTTDPTPGNNSATDVDTIDTRPTAVVNAANVTTQGGTTHTFTVTYTDDAAINVSTLDNNDVRVTGPNGFDQAATFVGVNTNTNGSPRIATYSFTAPGGTFDITDNGTYNIVMQAGQVTDTAGNTVRAGTIGTFTVGICNPQVTTLANAGAGSLREAVTNACSGSVITFAPNLAGTITLTSGEIAIPVNLTIQGPGANVITVNGNNASRVFSIPAGLDVSINDLTISGGRGDFGGAIFHVNSALNLRRVVLSGNTATSGGGGGVYNNAGTLTITDSTIASNTGGGVLNSGTLTITNSTISGNTFGAGVSNLAGTAALTSDTITNNASGTSNAGGGSFTVRNTIIAANAGNADVSGAYISGGYNLIGNAGTATGFNQTGDQTGTAGSPVNPQLAPLASNGGPTPTHAFANTVSPAIDKGKSFNLATDQRGSARPADFPSIAPAIGGDNSDIGAFEASTVTGGSGIDGDINRTNPNTPNSSDNVVDLKDLQWYDNFVNGTFIPETGGPAQPLTVGPSAQENQRRDVSPLATAGDGCLNAADRQQMVLFVLGLANAGPAGGPSVLNQCPPVRPGQTAAGGGNRLDEQMFSTDDRKRRGAVIDPAIMRAVRIINSEAENGEILVTIEMDATGEETRGLFTLNFDPAILSIDSSSFPAANQAVTLGADAPRGATIAVNGQMAPTGQITVYLDFAGAIPSGTQKGVVTLRFRVADGAVPSVVHLDPDSLQIINGEGSELKVRMKRDN